LSKTGAVLNLAKRRKSIRVFKSVAIDLEDVYYAINVALQAPSGANTQPWRFIIIIDNKIKHEIRRRCEESEKRLHENIKVEWFRKWLSDRGITWRKPFLSDAPVLIAVLSRKDVYYSKESTWLAIGYLLLALEERGLSSLTYTPSDKRCVSEVLRIPSEKYSLECVIPVGIAGAEKIKEPRLTLDDVTFFNMYGIKKP
jgi:nitroreductase